MSVGRKRIPRFRVGDEVRFLFGPQKVAGEILEDRGPLGVFGRRLYRVRIHHRKEDETAFEVLEEDIEAADKPAGPPDLPGLRQEFDVTYTRESKTNHWRAMATRGRLYKGMKAKGVVAYSTGRWEGERDGEENHATISVFIECDPSLCDSHSRVRASAWPVMTASVRELADRRFKTRHPDAVIEHCDDVED